MPGSIQRIEWNYDAFNALRKDPAIAADLLARGEQIAAAAGRGVIASASENNSRARVIVFTATEEARKAQAESHALTGAFDAGRS